jgi:hypothetical protein
MRRGFGTLDSTRNEFSAHSDLPDCTPAETTAPPTCRNDCRPLMAFSPAINLGNGREPHFLSAYWKLRHLGAICALRVYVFSGRGNVLLWVSRKSHATMGFMLRPIFLLFLLLSASSAFSDAKDPFLGVAPTRDYVPEGKPKRQHRISTVDQCQAVCARKDACKAYAFLASKPACYFYSQVFMGGTPRSRQMGEYSSGLSIVPKQGFVSAFKRSAFPPMLVPVRRPD